MIDKMIMINEPSYRMIKVQLICHSIQLLTISTADAKKEECVWNKIHKLRKKNVLKKRWSRLFYAAYCLIDIGSIVCFVFFSLHLLVCMWFLLIDSYFLCRRIRFQHPSPCNNCSTKKKNAWVDRFNMCHLIGGGCHFIFIL